MKKIVLVLVSLLAWSFGCVIVGIFVGDWINNAGTTRSGPTTAVLTEAAPLQDAKPQSLEALYRCSFGGVSGKAWNGASAEDKAAALELVNGLVDREAARIAADKPTAGRFAVVINWEGEEAPPEVLKHIHQRFKEKLPGAQELR
jgi:hypothetical protein